MIYVIRTVGCTPACFKVGFTDSDPRSRLNGLRTGCPFRLELVAVKKGDMAREKAIHSLLKEHSLEGEWFLDNMVTRRILKISNPKPLILGHNKNLLSRPQRMINRLVRKPCLSVCLEDICVSRNISISHILSMPKSKMAFTINKLCYQDALKALGYNGEEFDGFKTFLIKK